jgi:predicted AAA+ superfamily ATPase
LTILSLLDKIVSMDKPRYLEEPISDICFRTGKMAFVSGPRQCGKTTLAKHLLKVRGAGAYYNWDELAFRRLWATNPSAAILTVSHNTPLVIFDEIHKAKLWKRNLKGIFDTLKNPCDILVTGSARLNVYRKGSDSLLGRYYHFRLHPFSLAELIFQNKDQSEPDNLFKNLFARTIPVSARIKKSFEDLCTFGPFPEPLFAASKRTLNLWQRNRIERIVREDLRDISRLPELSQVEMLASLLPLRVANPLSIRSLSEDLEVSYTTVKRWLKYLEELYYLYLLLPYTKSLPRAIKKEPKLYLWDWSEVEDPGARFENVIASHLLKYCHYLTDTGYGKYELRYLRNKEKKEIDFLILKNEKPWFAVEAKLNEGTIPSENWGSFLKHIPCQYAIQVTHKPQVYKVIDFPTCKLLLVSADEFLSYLV